jgi:predicted TPR repeat methyltransferase
MPVSTTVHLSQCLGWIIQLEPRSILDVGFGFGTWGFLCREHLDVARERVHPADWQVRIDGIELFEPYIQPHQRALYSAITVGDIRALAPHVEHYDLIIAGDVIEHLEKAEGEAVLGHLYEKAQKALLVNIPLDGNWEHPERHGNPGELHRSQWSVDDFLPYPSMSQVFQLPCGTYGAFLCLKDGTLAHRIAGLVAAAERAEDLGHSTRAIEFLSTAHALAPADEPAAMFLSELLIRAGDTAAATDTLERCVGANPRFHYGRLALAKLHLAAHHPEPARRCLEALLAVPDAPQDLRSAAQRLLKSWG